MYPFMTLPVHFNTVFLITVKINPSTFLLFYLSTDVPVHHYNCAVYFFFFGITCTMSFRLVYWGTYTHIHPKRNLPVYFHAFLWFNNKYLPVSTTTCVPAHRCTRSWPYLFILILSFRHCGCFQTWLYTLFSLLVLVWQCVTDVWYKVILIVCPLVFNLHLPNVEWCIIRAY